MDDVAGIFVGFLDHAFQGMMPSFRGAGEAREPGIHNPNPIE